MAHAIRTRSIDLTCSRRSCALAAAAIIVITMVLGEAGTSTAGRVTLQQEEGMQQRRELADKESCSVSQVDIRLSMRMDDDEWAQSGRTPYIAMLNRCASCRAYDLVASCPGWTQDLVDEEVIHVAGDGTCHIKRGLLPQNGNLVPLRRRVFPAVRPLHMLSACFSCS